MGPRQKKAAPKRRAAPQSAKPRSRRGQGKSVGNVALHEIWHPAMSQHVWVPASLKNTALVRVRDYGQFQIVAGGANPVCVLISGCLNTSGALHIGQMGVTGAGATAGTAGTPLTSFNNFSAAYVAGRARLHRVGVTVSCLGPSAAGVLLPNTYLRMGALRSIMTPGSFATFADIANALGAKADLHTKTAYELMQKSAHVCATPIDRLEWQQLKPCVAGTTANYTADDGLATIAFLIGIGTSLDVYNFTVHLDYDYLPADEAATLVSSAAVTHPSLPERVLDSAANAANTVAGVFEGGERVAAGIARAGVAISRAVGHMPSAYPALTGRTWGPRIAAIATA